MCSSLGFEWSVDIDGSLVGAPDPIPNLATSFQTYTTLDVVGS